jgi:uncharacterized protein YndB with AHSA1/START domain/DNA-binding transcriptional ArsR family regulator
MDVRTDRVFKALSDATRRKLLDRLRERQGLTLGELCADLGMARQSATQHLAVLEAAGLVTWVRRGREKLHYLNPVPLHEIQERWIDRFERRRLRALAEIRRQAEEDDMADRRTYVYVTYIRAGAQRVWDALTDADLTARFWGHSNISDWEPGSSWAHRRTDGSRIADVAGTVLEAEPPQRLVMTFGDPGEDPATAPRVTFTITPHGDIVRLTVTHEGLADDADHEAAAAGWPAVLSNLKSLLETGEVLPQAPWEMHADLRDAQMAANDPA